MSETTQAVFLSYASQDSEAAKRICEALRAAGVEVWFDQNELVGGDVWDQKIRGQIASCALFVPIISAATQARREGYFRIEWKLAAQRTHAMADGTPFLLPVLIDGTRDTEALVPGEFRAVQWTKLSNGETPAKFSKRVKCLLGEGVDDAKPKFSGSSRAPLDSTTSNRPRRHWGLHSLGGIGVAVIALLLSHFGHESDSSPPETPASQNAPAPLSEARQLVVKVRILLNKTSMARAELVAADDLCKAAAALDSTDAEVWAAWAIVNTWYVFHNLDASDARRTAARDAAARAMQLDPESFEARLAQAFYWARGDSVKRAQESGNWDQPQRRSAIDLLEKLLKERPDDPRVLLNLGYLLSSTERGLKLMEQAAGDPAFAAVAWDELGWHYLNVRGDYRRAEAAVDKSLAAEAYWNNLTLKIRILAEWHGDLDGTLAQLSRMPPSALQEDWAVAVVLRVRGWRREPQEMLRFLEQVPAEWLSSNWYEGPKALRVADARRLAGQTEAARRDYRRAISQIDARLAADPNDPNLLALRAECLYRLEDYEEARRAFRTFREIIPQGRIEVNLLFGTPDEKIAEVESMLGNGGSWPTAWLLRIDPWFDAVRDDPRFAVLIQKTEADPNRSAKAKAPSN